MSKKLKQALEELLAAYDQWPDGQYLNKVYIAQAVAIIRQELGGSRGTDQGPTRKD